MYVMVRKSWQCACGDLIIVMSGDDGVPCVYDGGEKGAWCSCGTQNMVAVVRGRG